jgi:hypothetical protein
MVESPINSTNNLVIRLDKFIRKIKNLFAKSKILEYIKIHSEAVMDIGKYWYYCNNKSMCH